MDGVLQMLPRQTKRTEIGVEELGEGMMETSKKLIATGFCGEGWDRDGDSTFVVAERSLVGRHARFFIDNIFPSMVSALF